MKIRGPISCRTAECKKIAIRRESGESSGVGKEREISGYKRGDASVMGTVAIRTLMSNQ